MGRNPQTGEPVKIKASKKVTFRAGKDVFFQAGRGLAVAGTFCLLHLPAIPTFLPCGPIVLDRPTTRLPGGI
jgi:hypothetical protein